MLLAQARRAGLAGELLLLHARDNDEDLARALDQTRQHDLVVLSGGVATGRYDLVPRALDRLGARLLFHGVAQNPGRHMLFATRGPQLLFGLPGGPLASHHCFERYVTAAAATMMGLPKARISPPLQRGVLAAPLAVHSPYPLFRLARVEANQGDSPGLWPLETGGGLLAAAAAQAEATLQLPPGTYALKAGEKVSFRWLVRCR
jgi:molybdopterin molybdotransferase